MGKVSAGQYCAHNLSFPNICKALKVGNVFAAMAELGIAATLTGKNSACSFEKSSSVQCCRCLSQVPQPTCYWKSVGESD